MTASFDIVAPAVERWLSEKRPLIVGICGAQGSGKSTLARQLAEHLEAKHYRTAVLSIDDLYLPRQARAQLAEIIHPLFATRGVPGTHDVALGECVLGHLKTGKSVRLPRFDKATDEPMPESAWPEAQGCDVILFEGWCVGAVAEPDTSLNRPVNDLEGTEDEAAVWRRTVNDALKGPYQSLFARIDRLILLAAPDVSVVRDWRIEQEEDLRRRVTREGRSGVRLMTDAEIARFILFYERLTRHILNEMPARADLTLRLDASRNVMNRP